MKKSYASRTLVLSTLGAASLLSGCATSVGFNERTPLREEVAQRAQERQSLNTLVAPVSRVVETEAAYIPVVARKVSEHAWLRSTRVTIQTGKDPVPMSEILRALARQGVSITSELPLDRFQYSGFSLVDVDAESALRAISASVGLDYQADASRRMVTIKPMSSKTWYLNIGNRRSSFAAGGNTAANPSTTNAVAAAMSSGGAGGAGAATANNGGGGSAGSGRTEVASSDDFWASLKTELDSRLRLMLPEPAKAATTSAPPAMAPAALPPVVPPVPGANAAATPAAGAAGAAAAPALLPAVPAQAAPSASSDGILNYGSRQVGSFAVNPETGAVTVQAPHWVLQDLDLYFKRVQDMYNTDITFQGELLLLTSDSSKSEGLDISSFAKFANSRYGLAYQNNGLGGVTVSFPTQGSLIPTVAANAALSGPLVGIQSLKDGLQVFNAYLTNLGKVTTLQRPVLTSTSGVPADFRRTVTRYFNTVSQQAASGGASGGAAVGTQNQLIAQDFGTILRVNPRIDISTGLIRAQIELVQTTQVGTQSVSQSLTSGTSVQQVSTALPVVSRIVYSGEALLKDGDLVVMGGQTEDSETSSRDGVTGLMDSPVGGVFGKTSREASRNVFYFALRVSVNKR